MSNIIINGWGQKSDSFKAIYPDAKYINYGDFLTTEELFENSKGECEILLGWSLGGQLALRALHEGYIKAKYLVLIATPFQFVQDQYLKCGMPNEVFNVFRKKFHKVPEKTMKKFMHMILKNDSNPDAAKYLELDISNALKWGKWLDELYNFSFRQIEFNNIPKTLIIHGRDDIIVEPSQSSLFLPFIEDLDIKIINNCGHAPQFHDIENFKKLVQDFHG